MEQAERFRRLTCTQHVRSDLPARSVRAAALTGASGFIDFAVRIGSTAILARLLLPEHFGLIMMAMAVTAIADQLRELGLSSATVQQPEITAGQVSNLFWINVGVGVALAALVTAAAPAIAAYYHEPRLTPIAALLSLTFICGGLTVQHQALLTRRLQLGHTSAVRLVSSVLSTALAIGLAAAGYGYWALLWREIARAALLALGMWLCFPWVPGLPDRNANIRGMLRFGAHLTAANILSSVASGADRFLLGRFWGAGPVAMYRQAFQLISAPTDQLLSPLYQVTQPSLSMLQNEPVRYRRFFARVVTVVGLVTMPVSLFTAVYAREITRVLLGPQWTDSAPVLAVLALGTFVKQAANCTAFVPITLGRGRVYLGLTILQNVLLVAFMAGGARWGAIGVAAADVLVAYLLIAPRLYYSFRGSPVGAAQFFRALARPAVASLAMAGVLLVWRNQLLLASPLTALVAAALPASVVFAGTWLLLPGGRVEWQRLVADARLALRGRTSGPKPAAPVAALP